MAVKSKPRVDLSDLIDVAGAAKLVFVNPGTVENWLSKKLIRRYKVGIGRRARTLVSKRELAEFVQPVK